MTQAQIRHRQIRLNLNRSLIRRNRLFRSPLLEQHVPQVSMRLRKIRLQFGNPAIFRQHLMD